MVAEGVWIVCLGLAAGACAASLGCVVGSRYAAEADPDNVNWRWLVRAWSCETCGVRLAAWRTLPAVGGWLARAAGGCRVCGGSGRLAWPLVEAAGAAVVCVLALQSGWEGLGVGCLLVGTSAAVLAADLECAVVPPGLAVPLLWSGLLVGPAGGAAGLAWAAAWGAVVWVLVIAGEARGRLWIGRGDIAVVASVGAWAGSASMIAVAGACGCCAVAGWLSRDRGSPLAPFVVMVMWAAVAAIELQVTDRLGALGFGL